MADGTKSFAFSSKRAAGSKKGPVIIESFDIDGSSFDIRALKDSSVAYLVHQTKGGEANVVIAAVLDFTERALTAESAKRFEALALGLDGGEGLDLEQIVEVFQYILGVVGGHPTGPSSASSSAPRRTGTASRGTSRARAASTS